MRTDTSGLVRPWDMLGLWLKTGIGETGASTALGHVGFMAIFSMQMELENIFGHHL